MYVFFVEEEAWEEELVTYNITIYGYKCKMLGEGGCAS
jgi:hypothetical protein